MRHGSKFLNSLFEITHVEFQTYDLCNDELIFSNGMLHKLLGYSADEYRNLSHDFYKTIVHPDDYQKVQATIHAIKKAEGGDVIEMAARVRKSDGNYIWVYSRQMIYEKKHRSNVCTMIREVEDITQLVELQDALKEKVEQLNIISFKNSHLLRSPVASIIGLVDLIEEHSMTGDHNRQILQFLRDAIVKLDRVIHEINDIARIDQPSPALLATGNIDLANTNPDTAK
jgi:PAS domain S-box-containing protein